MIPSPWYFGSYPGPNTTAGC